MQSVHLDFYGSFARDWTRYEQFFEETGQSIPYWYNLKLQKSTWDSPILILEAFMLGGVDSDESAIVRDWNPMTGKQSDWIRVKIKGHGKQHQKRYVFVNRKTKELRQEEPTS